MKPWEIDYNGSATSSVEETTSSKPWERDWGQEQDFSAAKPHQIFSIDGSNTNAQARLGAAAKSFHKNKKLHNAAVFGDSISKSVVRGIYDTGGGIGSFINWYGDNMILPDDFMGLDKKTIDRLNTFGRGWQKAGSALRKGADFVLNSEALELDEETFSGDFVDNPSFTRTASAFASAAPSLMSMAGLFKLTGSAGLAYFVMGGVDSADIYEASKEAGQDLETTNLLYTTAMGGTALVDRFLSPVENILGKKIAGKTLARKIADHVSGGLLEATGEGTQTLWQNAVEKYGIDDTKNLFEGVVESAIGGFGAGAFATGAFDRANNKLLDKGASQEEINALVDAAGMYAQKHPDEINDIAFQHLNQGLSNFEKFIEEHKGTPEAAAAMQKKADLEAVGKMAFDNLIKAGQSEKVARAQSQILQGIILWGSEETGLSPIEYLNQRFPQIRQEKFADFKARFTETKNRADAQNVDLFEALVNPEVYRKIEKAEAGKKGDSLLSFLKKRGGLKDVGGDLKAMDAGKQYVGIINNKSGVSLDDAALSAWENGYFPNTTERPTIQDLKDAIRDELFGKKRYAYQDGENNSVVDDVNRLAEAFDMLGIDYSKMSAREAEKAYNEAADNYNSQKEEAPSIVQEWDDIPFQSVIAKKTDVSTQSDPKQIRADAKKYLKEIIKKQNIEHPELGKIRVSKKGIDEFLHASGNLDKLALVPHLKELIETSTVGEKEGLMHERHDGIVAFYPLYNDAIIDGKPYDVTTKIGVDENGNLFYTILLDEKNSFQDSNKETKSKPNKEAINLNISPSKYDVNKSFYQLPPKAYKDGKADINTPEFKRWFGDSKVVDENGKPLVVYHGTNTAFDTFSKEKIKRGIGFWFSSDKETAEEYGDIKDFYLSIKNPIDINKNRSDFIRLVKEAIPEEIPNDVSEHYVISEALGSTPFKEYLQNKGYDAISLGKSYIVFEPNQIKSVYNRGSFSQKTDNIYYQTAFAGSRVDYDRPSLEAIGSGEGNQAHGWGLYYALIKYVAEQYRKNFVKGTSQLVIGDKSIEDWVNSYAWNNECYDIADNMINQIIRHLEFREKKQNDIYEARQSVLQDIEEYAQDLRDYLKKGSDDEVYIKHVKEDLANVENLRDKIATYNAKKFNFKEQKGQVHEVDIPENPYLLDEQKPFSEQSDFVKSKLRKLAEDYSELLEDSDLLSSIADNETGGDFYNLLVAKQENAYRQANAEGNAKKYASKELENVGIKGITYDGRQDGRCFVIFNPKDVKVIQKFYQGKDNRPNGAFYDNVIYLFEKANASTFMHETAHWFRNELKSFNSDKSRALLDKVNKWEAEEFARHYKLDLHNGRYVVRDALGNIIYDQNFQSKEQAQEYAQNELFARGFETYLKEGKSPNNYMKQAFKSFWNWLRHLYRSAKSLNVDLNDDIRAVYDDIIGGEDIDFYMNAPSEEVMQRRIELQKEREKELDDMIGQVVSQSKNEHRNIFTNFVAERTNSLKDRTKWWTQAIVPISTRAARISPRLKNKLRAYDYKLNQKLNERLASIKPFLDTWATFSNEDMTAFDFALKNQYIKKQNQILKKYKAEDQFEAVKALLENLYNEAGDVRVEMGYKADYFPRQVEDVEGLMTYLHGSEMASDLRRAEKEAGFENMTPEEQSDFINKFLRGYNRKDTTAPLPSNIKQRRIDIVTPELNVFYKPSMQALTNYVDRMNAAIESRKFWGFDMENIDDSIGAFVDEMITNGEIRPDQDKEVETILRARFKAKGVSNKSLSFYKNMSYLYTMGGINSAITQIDDISVALYKAGFWNTVNSILHKNRTGLSREELGLSNIGQEFMEASTSSKAVDKVFKLTGLDAIDGFGKNVLINATFEKFQKMAKKSEDTLRARIEPIMEQETSQTIEDIKNGEISDNVKLLMFNELADMQPISLSEMPEWYLTSGNGRVMYMLKTFMLKRIDIFRNECFDKIRSGQTKEGLQNLFKVASLMIFCGASKDAILDLIFGRKIYIGDIFVNNALGLFGFTKYQLYKARDEGFEGFASSFIPPLFAFWGDLGRDVSKKLFSKNGKDIKDFEIWKGVPIFGRFYYWWFGGGYAKEQKKHKKKLK